MLDTWDAGGDDAVNDTRKLSHRNRGFRKWERLPKLDLQYPPKRDIHPVAKRIPCEPLQRHGHDLANARSARDQTQTHDDHENRPLTHRPANTPNERHG